MKKILFKIWMFFATVIIMLMAGTLIVILAIAKFFRFFKDINFKDPFHNSRQHPLNSPEAPRG